MTTFSKIGFIGGGVFGSALASVAKTATNNPCPVLVRTVKAETHTISPQGLQATDALVYAAKAQALPEVIPVLVQAGLALKPLMIAAKGLLIGDTPLLINKARNLGWSGDMA
ncbi:MAG: hypothetical protein ACPGVN_06190, partial [Alphaproteobacteria bacterium]